MIKRSAVIFLVCAVLMSTAAFLNVVIKHYWPMLEGFPYWLGGSFYGRYLLKRGL